MTMIKGVTCLACGAGFRRLELPFERGAKGEYCCPVCGTMLEKFDGETLVAYRLTVRPFETRVAALCTEIRTARADHSNCPAPIDSSRNQQP